MLLVACHLPLLETVRYSGHTQQTLHVCICPQEERELSKDAKGIFGSFLDVLRSGKV